MDNSIITGNEDLVQEAIRDLKRFFNMAVQGNLEDYLGCEIIKTKDGFQIAQKRIVKDSTENFKDFPPGRIFDSPSPDRYIVERIIDQELDEEKEKLFRSGIGSLLHLVKHLRPDLSNCVRESFKIMNIGED